MTTTKVNQSDTSFTSSARKDIEDTSAYLSKCALNLSEEVIIRDLRAVIIHVIDGKPQSLNLLKVVIQLKGMRELRTQWVLDILSSTCLVAHVKTQLHASIDWLTHYCSTVCIYILFLVNVMATIGLVPVMWQMTIIF